MQNIYQALPEESKKIIQDFLLDFKSKIASDLTDYQRVTQEIKKTAEKGLETRMQLHQIDKETEKAATGIIEKSELMMDRQNELTELAKKMNNNLKEEGNKLMPGFENLLFNILEVGKIIKGKELEKSLKDKITLIEQDLILMTADKIRSQKLLLQVASKLEENANNNLDDLFEILNLCQFQDITSQELAKAHSLIKTIVERLNFVLEAFHVNGIEIDEKMEIKAFDSNASFTDKTKEQQEADILFSEPSKPQASTPKEEKPQINKTIETDSSSEDLFEQLQKEMKQQESTQSIVKEPIEESGTNESENVNPEDLFEQLQKEIKQNEENHQTKQSESRSVDEDELEKILTEADQLIQQETSEEEEIEIPEDLLKEISENEQTTPQSQEPIETTNEKVTSPPPSTPQESKTSANESVDIDELAKKFEEAGSGEVISQEEIDRILSGDG